MHRGGREPAQAAPGGGHAAPWLHRELDTRLAQNRHLATELVRLLRLAAGANIALLPFKGPILAAAIYGDLAPHLHFHLVPKYRGGPEWGQPFALHPPAHRHLAEAGYRELVAGIWHPLAVTSRGLLKKFHLLRWHYDLSAEIPVTAGTGTDGRRYARLGTSRPAWSRDLLGLPDRHRGFSVLAVQQANRHSCRRNRPHLSRERSGTIGILRHRRRTTRAENGDKRRPARGAKPLGPFYELESSSPAAALAPGKTLSHTHQTFHVCGPKPALDTIARRVFGVAQADIASALPQ